MLASKISSKGQTTIPVEVQRTLRVSPGDKIQYFLEPDGRVTLVPKIHSVADLAGILPPPTKAVSVEDMKRAVADHAAALNEL